MDFGFTPPHVASPVPATRPNPATIPAQHVSRRRQARPDKLSSETIMNDSILVKLLIKLETTKATTELFEIYQKDGKLALDAAVIGYLRGANAVISSLLSDDEYREWHNDVTTAMVNDHAAISSKRREMAK
jgi:hypothetical protein